MRNGFDRWNALPHPDRVKGRRDALVQADHLPWQWRKAAGTNKLPNPLDVAIERYLRMFLDCGWGAPCIPGRQTQGEHYGGKPGAARAPASGMRNVQGFPSFV
jgi:hypothetical protein